MASYNIGIVTSTRADYGLLRPLISKFTKNKYFNVRLIVTGAHLCEQFANTVSEIENDNNDIFAKIDILKFGTSTNLQIAKTIAYTIKTFAAFLSKKQNRPDALLVLGDRYEIFAVCTAASALSIPIIHISGGDVTHGSADDYYRHCITKMSRLHFPSCEQYANRLINMGENPMFVHNVGGLGDENLRKLKLLSRKELSDSLNFNLEQKFALITYHPETAGNVESVTQFKSLLNALKYFDIACIFTKANADSGGIKINKLIDSACQRNKNYINFTSMGALRYISAMKYCAAVIGNSSSGVVETPTFKVPTVNIGARQKGRIISANIINCAADENSIKSAIEKALSNEFTHIAAQAVSPYNGGDTAQKIVDLTLTYLQGEHYASPKEFYDV